MRRFKNAGIPTKECTHLLDGILESVVFFSVTGSDKDASNKVSFCNYAEQPVPFRENMNPLSSS